MNWKKSLGEGAPLWIDMLLSLFFCLAPSHFRRVYGEAREGEGVWSYSLIPVLVREIRISESVKVSIHLISL